MGVIVRGPIVVTAAVIERGDLVLITRRRPDASLEALKWEFPGGKMEAGESPEKCLRREILEELALDVTVGPLVGVSSHVYPSPSGEALHILLLCYRCSSDGEPQALEVDAFRWVSRSELNRFEFAAADVPLLPLV